MMKGMDPLGDISGSDSDDDVAGAAEGPEPAKTKPKEIDYAALQKAGFAGSASILAIKDSSGDQSSWGWGQGQRTSHDGRAAHAIVRNRCFRTLAGTL